MHSLSRAIPDRIRFFSSFIYQLDSKKIATFLFLFFFTLFLFLGSLITLPTSPTLNAIFSADNARVFGDMAKVDYDHYRIKVHPLFLILVQPVVHLMTGITGNPLFSVLIVEAAAGSGVCAFLFLILNKFQISQIRSLTLVAILGFAFSSMIFSSIPETFMLAALGLIAFWHFAIKASRAERRVFSRSEFAIVIFFGIISFGITITNYIFFLIPLIFLCRQRYDAGRRAAPFFLVNIICLVAIVALSLLQNAAWPQCPLFWSSILDSINGIQPYEEFNYISTDFSLSKIYEWIKQLFVYPLIGGTPAIAQAPNGLPTIVFTHLDLLPKIAVVAFWATSIYLLITFVARKDCAIERTPSERTSLAYLSASWLGNCALHFFYSPDAAFLYSPHSLFLAFLCLGIMSPRSAQPLRMNNIFLGAFLVIEIAWNSRTFLQTALEYAFIEHATILPLHGAIVALSLGLILSAIAVHQFTVSKASRFSWPKFKRLISGYFFLILLYCYFSLVN